jgi:hypothetical protein
LIRHGSAPGAEVRTATAGDLIVVQPAIGDRGRAAQVADGTAEVVEVHRRDGLVTAQFAIAEAQAGTDVVENRAAAPSAGGLVKIHRCARLVIGQRAVLDGQAGAGIVEDRAAAEATRGLIVGQGDTSEGQVRAGLIQDGASVVGQSIGDGQVRDGHGHAATDVEDPARGIAADGQFVGAEALDIQALGEGQLTACQSDCLPLERFGEPDGIAAACCGDPIAQRASPAVQIVQDRQRAEHGAIFEAFEQRAEPALPVSPGPAGFPGAQPTFGMILGTPHGEHLLFGNAVCDRMKKSSIPARRPSAGVMPGR